MVTRPGIGWFITTTVGFISCAGHPVPQRVVTQAEAARAQLTSAVTGDELSASTQQVLRVLNLAGSWRDESAATPERVATSQLGLPGWERGVAEAELYYWLAVRAGEGERAQGLYLEAALAAANAVGSAPKDVSAFDPRQHLAAQIYNRGTARFLAIGQALHGHPSTWQRVPGAQGDRAFSVEVGPGQWNPDNFDLFVPADERVFAGRLQNRYREYGYGAPLIGYRDLEQANRWSFEGPTNRSLPATALLFGTPDQRVELFLADPFRMKTVETPTASYPLSADFSAPIGYAIAQLPNPSAKENLGLFSPEQAEVERGVYLLQPYDPTRIPLLCIHGLWSSPVTWLELINEVWGDEELRSRYQVWQYFYPTGLSIPINAAGLRRDLKKLRNELDPEGDDLASQDMVVIGHSMGGVLAKTMISTSGQDLWNASATKSIAEFKLNNSDRALLEEIMFFTPTPGVRRVIFAAAPHRGSASADGLTGTLGAWLVSIPDDLTERSSRIIADNADAVRHGNTGPQTSIDNLAASSFVLQTLTELPIRPGIPYHSIMGDVTGKGAPDATDGYVSYRSAHLEGAQSELVVSSDHSVHRTPDALLEIRRILREHLR